MKRGLSDHQNHNTIEIHKNDNEQLMAFKAEIKTHRKFRESNRPLVVLGLLFVMIFFFSAAMFVTVSTDHMYLSFVLELSRQKLMYFFNFVIGQGAEGGIDFMTYRYIMIALAGASLSVSGAVYQGTFRNILASPTTLGVESGGSLGNVIYVLCFIGTGTTVLRFSESLNLSETYNTIDRNIQQLLVLGGCFASVFLVVGVTALAGKGKVRSSHLILAGILFSAIISSFTMLVQYYLLLANPYDTRVDIIRSLTMGSFDRAFTIEHLAFMSVFLVPGLIFVIMMCNKMNIFTLGEDDAATMGLNVNRFRYGMIAVNTFMTAVVIAYCGQLGFVGFIVPQAARKIVGPDFRRVIPASMLLGAILLIVVYDAALVIGLTSYINLITSSLGSVIMIAAFVKGQGRTYAN